MGISRSRHCVPRFSGSRGGGYFLAPQDVAAHRRRMRFGGRRGGGYFLAPQDIALPGGFPAPCFPKCRERTGGGPSPPPPVPPGSGQPKSPLRGPFDRCRQAVGSGRGNVPVNHGPQPASMRAAPACRQRLSDFEADNTRSFSWLQSIR